MFHPLCFVLWLFIALLPEVLMAQTFAPFQPLPDEPPIPVTNPQSALKTALGKQLFFDRRLSVNNSKSCNDCHDLGAAGVDGLSLSNGAAGMTAGRNTPTLWNVAYQTVLFWDGRAASLEEAIEQHLLDPEIMAMPDKDSVTARIDSVPAYTARFARVFGSENIVSYENLTKVLAAFIRTLTTPGSAFDRYLKGEKTAISRQAQRGYDLFIETGCASCHFWVNLSGPVPGLAFKAGEGFYELFPNYPGTQYDRRYQLTADLGRYLVTGDVEDKRMWRVPVLRNIALTAPYFHNGTVERLEEAIKVMAETQLGKTLDNRQLSEIAAFLNTLNGPFRKITVPKLPE